MPSKKFPTIWQAPPHTVAKIEMLRAYLVAWFQILGRSRRGQELLYVDGFAGPGEYTNYPTGSPLAALSAAKEAMELTGTKWIAGKIIARSSKLIAKDAITSARRSMRSQNLAE